MADKIITPEIIETAQCVKINFDNLKSMMPLMKQHPMLPIFEMQLAELLKLLGAE